MGLCGHVHCADITYLNTGRAFTTNALTCIDSETQERIRSELNIVHVTQVRQMEKQYHDVRRDVYVTAEHKTLA